MTITLPAHINDVKGFLADDEAHALHEYALSVAERGPVLEVGSYCGKSTIYLGLACQQKNSVVYAVDHHVGSEEHQLGEMFHDPDLYDAGEGRFDTFKDFRRNMTPSFPSWRHQKSARDTGTHPSPWSLSTVVTALMPHCATTAAGRAKLSPVAYSPFTIYFPRQKKAAKHPMPFTKWH